MCACSEDFAQGKRSTRRICYTLMTSSTGGQKTLEMSANASAKNHVGTERRELEWQLTAEDLGAVRRWLAEHHTVDGLTIEPRSPVQIDDTYFDTCDRRIQRAGFALRMRKAAGESEATLKELRSANAKVADRRELTEPLLTDAGARRNLSLRRSSRYARACSRRCALIGDALRRSHGAAALCGSKAGWRRGSW